MFCRNCGSPNDDGARFCEQCGKEMRSGVDSQSRQADTNIPPVSSAVVSASDWDGSVLETLGASIVYTLVTMITCGIGAPWAICFLYKFIISHTKIDGRRLRFDGTGGSLFGNWLIWMLLTVITCGIYGFWVAPKMYKWFASHTHFE